MLIGSGQHAAVMVIVLTLGQMKTLEITRLMLGNGHKKIVASTIAEIRGALPLVADGVLEEVRITSRALDTRARF